MIRTLLRTTRSVVQALLLLVLLLCGAEAAVGLWWTEPPATRPDPGRAEARWLVASPRTHHALRPLAVLSERLADSSGSHQVRTNSLGLRGPEPAVPKPPGTFRIVCLGDELVLGPGVDESETFCHRLEELLQPVTSLRVEVINAGVPGYCPLLSYLQVRHGLLSLDVDLWIVNFAMDDVAEDYRYRFQTRCTEDGDPLACSHPRFGLVDETTYTRLRRRFRLVRWSSDELGRAWRRAYREPRSPGSVDPGDRAGRYAWLGDDSGNWAIHVQQALDPVKRLSRLGRGRLLLVVCPAPRLLMSPSSRPRGAAGGGTADVVAGRVVAEFAARHGLPCCDLAESLHRQEDSAPLYLAGRSVLSATGHAEFARVLARSLVRSRSEVRRASASELQVPLVPLDAGQPGR